MISIPWALVLLFGLSYVLMASVALQSRRWRKRAIKAAEETSDVAVAKGYLPNEWTTFKKTLIFLAPLLLSIPYGLDAGCNGGQFVKGLATLPQKKIKISLFAGQTVKRLKPRREVGYLQATSCKGRDVLDYVTFPPQSGVDRKGVGVFGWSTKVGACLETPLLEPCVRGKKYPSFKAKSAPAWCKAPKRVVRRKLPTTKPKTRK